MSGLKRLDGEQLPEKARAVVAGIQVTVQFGVMLDDNVQLQQPVAFPVPTPEHLAGLPAEIEKTRRELQARIEAQEE